MKWLKKRTRWASGISNWEYEPLFVEQIDRETKTLINENINNIRNENFWGDFFRGVDYEVVNTKEVPNSEILKACDILKKKIDSAIESITRNCNYLKQVEKLRGEGKD